MTNRTCTECGKVLHGRADKKFCNDGCRNAHNNRVNAPATNFIRNVNATLGRNRKILDELNPSGKVKVKREMLLKNGFDFEYYTNSHTTKSGDTYRFCYEQGYLVLESGYVLLVYNRNQ